MNIKPMMKYQLKNALLTVVIYEGVMIAVTLLLQLLTIGRSMSVSGMETSTAFVLFILGLNSFKTQFFMGLQHGVSRRTFVAGTAAALGIVALGVTLYDVCYYSLCEGVFARFTSSFQILFDGLMQSLSPAAIVLQRLTFWFSVNLTCVFAGLFVTSLYYNMNKALKLIVSIGVPVTALFIFPIVDFALWHGSVSAWLSNAVVWIYSLPLRASLIHVGLTAAFGALAWLLIRRAQIKTA